MKVAVDQYRGEVNDIVLFRELNHLLKQTFATAIMTGSVASKEIAAGGQDTISQYNETLIEPHQGKPPLVELLNVEEAAMSSAHYLPLADVSPSSPS